MIRKYSVYFTIFQSPWMYRQSFCFIHEWPHSSNERLGDKAIRHIAERFSIELGDRAKNFVPETDEKRIIEELTQKNFALINDGQRSITNIVVKPIEENIKPIESACRMWG